MCDFQDIFFLAPNLFTLLFKEEWLHVTLEGNVFMAVTVYYFHSVSQDIVFGKSTNNAVQILLSGDIQSWNVLHPVLLLLL